MIYLGRFKNKPNFEQKKLREVFGNFATGVIIVAGCRKSYFSKAAKFWQEVGEKKFFAENFLKKYKIDDKKIFLIRQNVERMLQNRLFEGELLKKFKNLFSDHLYGMTINSFTSVSLTPALVSICIDNRSLSLAQFKRGEYFSLNILGADKQGLAAAFAKAGNVAKWQYEPFLVSELGNPVFTGSLAVIECKKHRLIKMGDHHILVGEVVNFSLKEQSSGDLPLTYWRGKFGISSN